MIYLDEEEESPFIVPYEKEAMINNKIYHIKTHFGKSIPD